jgi:hypothetical protein
MALTDLDVDRLVFVLDAMAFTLPEQDIVAIILLPPTAL